MTPETAVELGVVLVVEDTPEHLALLSTALDDAGYVVLSARDGAEALRVLETMQPDVILLDALMPGLDGFQTCALIKQQERLAQVPVIFMTALTESAHVLHGFATGAIDYVTKPIRIDELLARLETHLRAARHLRHLYQALEASHQAVMVCNSFGALIWKSSRAASLLASHGADYAEQLGRVEAWRQWLRQRANGAADTSAFVTGDLEFKLMARYSHEEFLVVVERVVVTPAASTLAQHFNLTTREAEVLLWATRGKSSRDIAQILSMSPRTVDKHFEHIFEKLGVESRTSAVAIALKPLNQK